MVEVITPSRLPNSFRILPSGDTIKECPKVFLPLQCFPACPGAKTYEKFSIALAFNKVCQCLLQVVSVKAEGMLKKIAPFFDIFLYMLGNLRS